MTTDLWHYARTTLAEQILGMFETGLSSALVFFAPRRMGKTEFLCKDIMPLAEDRNWKVFYFSFLDLNVVTAEFTKSLAIFAERAGALNKARSLLQRIHKISGEAAGVRANVEFSNTRELNYDMKEIIAKLAVKKRVLLLMDEVQTLAEHTENAQFIAALRTALDIHKDNVKVIFTGSSQEGLRRMFSQAKAPFFHFGQNLPFPELDKEFTDHLAHVFERVTRRKLNTDLLWSAFEEMQKIPQLARALVERLALHPNLDLQETKKQLLAEIFIDREFLELWERCSALERLLLCQIAADVTALFSVEIRNDFAKFLGISDLPVSSVQSAIRTLQRKGLIGRLPERRAYCIDDPNFKNWLQTQEAR